MVLDVLADISFPCTHWRLEPFRLRPSLLQGWTPLMSAVSAGREEAVAALLAGGADVSAKNSSGQTALHYAVRACCCLMHTRSQGLSS